MLALGKVGAFHCHSVRPREVLIALDKVNDGFFGAVRKLDVQFLNAFDRL